MPGSGKSTVGRLLAERLGWRFVDVDQLIEASAGLRLPEIVAAEGFEGLALRERKANSELTADRCVIAPGGSVIYFDEAMENLRSLGTVVYLHVPARVLERRAGDLVERATIIRPGMTFADLAAEREPLYRKHADFVVACGGDEAPSAIAERVFELFRRVGGGLDGL
jgi:shikimate kinase